MKDFITRIRIFSSYFLSQRIIVEEQDEDGTRNNYLVQNESVIKNGERNECFSCT